MGTEREEQQDPKRQKLVASPLASFWAKHIEITPQEGSKNKTLDTASSFASLWARTEEPIGREVALKEQRPVSRVSSRGTTKSPLGLASPDSVDTVEP